MKRFTTLVASRMKSLTVMLMVAFTAIGFTSCDEDQFVGMSLTGVWGGYISEDVFSHRYGTGRESMYAEIEFYSDPFHVKSGRGIEYDYVSKYSSLKYYFRYTVRDGVIYIEYDDDTSVAISNYYLRDDIFHGVFQDSKTGKKLATFDLRKLSEHVDSKAMTQTELEE